MTFSGSNSPNAAKEFARLYKLNPKRFGCDLKHAAEGATKKGGGGPGQGQESRRHNNPSSNRDGFRKRHRSITPAGKDHGSAAKN